MQLTSAVAPALPNGYSSVAAGHLAAVVTSLEMRERPAPRSAQAFPAGISLQPLGRPSVERYRALYRAVGEDWLWVSRLVMPDDKLRAILEDPLVEIFALQKDGVDAGILELDFREPDTCELAFFGVTMAVQGSGMGRALMNQAIERAWSRPIRRFWVHTCTLDHPAALDFYRRSGFTPFAFQVEVMPDPRLTGAMPRNCAPQIPIVEAD
ncbi:N-acetyltransferase [Kaistia sp. 32K]|uniref:GNAT family N-acetyltransferase n=1 Tax=Kaistia sp. 32K TaxID=2795690 RepID=UPI001915B8A1|nr:GNAT family N-acetyltransferase [Kaistia sp. 32K]BCP51736.1 N-acetyltransferase [Kaistia sp. 32K]